MNKLTSGILGWMFGLLAGSMLTIYSYDLTKEPPIEKLKLELAAYRHCLDQASKMQCRMTPQDFVRYYELKYQLEAANEGQKQK